MKAFTLVSLLLLSSCFKSSEEIAREERVDELLRTLDQTQQETASARVRAQEVAQERASMQGKLEDIEHRQLQIMQRLDEMESTRLKATMEQQALNTEQLEELKSKVRDLGRYTKRVNTQISRMARSKSGKSDAQLMEKAHRLYRKGKLESALAIYDQIIGSKKLSASKKNRIHLHSGMVHYRKKRYESALVHFSKIYTKYPKSSMSPQALYFIGQSFHGQQKSEEAITSLQELIDRYPKSRYSKLAKDKLKKWGASS